MRFFLLVMICFLTLCANTQAHESRPLHIDINETSPYTFTLKWKKPPSVIHRNTPDVLLSGCNSNVLPVVMNVGDELVKKQQFLCSENLSKISIEYPLYNPSVSTLIRLRLLSGESHSKLLGPEDAVWEVPDQESKAGVAVDYTRLGITHIWAGVDHLLFLVCLLLIAGTGRRIIITVTGFTIAHSATLALSALKWVTLPVAPVETVIALSIVFLASEIAKGRRDTLTWNYPVVVSATFGLLHGLGFASVLNDIGLPQTELALGLLFFNIGVEIGQIIFVLVVLLLFNLFSRLQFGIKESVIEKPAAYTVGILASYWMLERASGIAIS